MSTMRSMLNSRISIAVFFASVLSTLSSCSDGHTVLALTISSTADVGMVANLRVTVSRGSATSKSIEFVPDATDAGIVASFFKRIPLDGWKDGNAMVRVEALDAAGTAFLTAMTMAEIQENHVVAATVHLARQLPDGGSDSGG